MQQLAPKSKAVTQPSRQRKEFIDLNFHFVSFACKTVEGTGPPETRNTDRRTPFSHNTRAPLDSTGKFNDSKQGSAAPKARVSRIPGQSESASHGHMHKMTCPGARAESRASRPVRRAQVPKCPSAQVPKCPSAQVPKCPSAPPYKVLPPPFFVLIYVQVSESAVTPSLRHKTYVTVL